MLESTLESRLIECYREEQRALSETRPRPSSKEFGVSLSGGGIRAMMFSVGVLDELGRRGLLDRATHISAVSGGGYAAGAYLTTLADCSGAREASGRLRRIAIESAGYVTLGPSRWLGACCGTCVGALRFGGVVASTFVFGFASMVLFYMLPVASFMNLTHGRQMRRHFCSSSKKNHGTVRLQVDDVGNVHLALLSGAVSVPSADVWILICVTSTWFLYRFLVMKSGGRAQTDFQAGVRGVLKSSFTAVTWYVVMLCLVQYSEHYDYKYKSSPGHKNKVKCACAEWYGPGWFKWDDAEYDERCGDGRRNREEILGPSSHILFVWTSLLFISALFSFLAYLTYSLNGPSVSLISLTFWLIIPMSIVLLLSQIVRMRVYGPITHQYLFYDFLSYRYEVWRTTMLVTYSLFLVYLLFQHETAKLLYYHYADRLRVAFFQDQKIYKVADLKPSQGKPYPILLLGAMVNRWRFVDANRDGGERDGAREENELQAWKRHFVITPFYWGGAVVNGPFKTPQWLRLHRATAISGAAIDALFFGDDRRFGHVPARILIQSLNLNMGTWMPFNADEDDDENETRRCSSLLCDDKESWLTLRRRRWDIAWLGTVIVLLFIGSYKHVEGDDQLSTKDMGAASRLILSGFVLFIGLVALSFFGHVNLRLRWLLASPMIQQVQAALNYEANGTIHPPSLMLADGGLGDCTAVVELLKRRLGRILCVDSTNPDGSILNFESLLLSIRIAIHEKVAFDFRDARDGLGYTEALGRCAAQGDNVVFLKATYPPTQKESEHPNAEVGEVDIIVVKLAPDLGERRSRHDLLSRGCCCSCCHDDNCFVCCGIFPLLNNANQFLTVEQCEELISLGSSVVASDPVIERLQ